MYTFFTVARNDISEMPVLDFIKNSREMLQYNFPNFYSAEDAINKIMEIYPDGLSHHGQQYLCNHYIINDKFVQYMPILETTFELVRLWKFPDRPSRFTSAFGCLTKEDAKIFRNEFCSGKGEIYMVACDFF